MEQKSNLTKFDSSLGTLTSVVFSYGGSFDTSIQVESRVAQPAVITGSSAGALTFGGPITDVLNISDSQTFNASAFDGIIDFGGTSGHDFGTISGSSSGSKTLLSGLSAYIGVGTYAINVDAAGSSSATGAGNLLASIATQAKGNIQVTYNYDVPPPPHVPEPATLTLMGMGLAGFAASRRKKQA